MGAGCRVRQRTAWCLLSPWTRKMRAAHVTFWGDVHASGGQGPRKRGQASWEQSCSSVSLSPGPAQSVREEGHLAQDLISPGCLPQRPPRPTRESGFTGSLRGAASGMTLGGGVSDPSVCGLTSVTQGRWTCRPSITHHWTPGRVHLSAAVNAGAPRSVRGAAMILLGTDVGWWACAMASVLMRRGGRAVVRGRRITEHLLLAACFLVLLIAVLTPALAFNTFSRTLFFPQVFYNYPI